MNKMENNESKKSELKNSDLIFRNGLLHGEEKDIIDITRSTGFFHEDEIQIAGELALESIQKGQDVSGYHFVVCEYRSKIVGYTCYGEIPCTRARYDLYWIVVQQEMRGMKIGQKLMDVTQDRVKEKGGKKIYIETSSRDLYVGTRKFYDVCQYKVEAVFKDFYDDGDDKWVFIKNL